MRCRHCNAEVRLPFLDLGSAPPSNAYLSAEQLQAPEVWYPLRLLVCESCWLVQTEDYAGREQLFNAEYAYFSSFSTTWLEHARRYVQEMITRFKLGEDSCVVEVAANDGYLLQYVAQAGIPCYGIEPTAGTAAAAREKGIEIVERFFGANLAEELAQAGRQADLVVANNVLAHVPDINDFVKGFERFLKPHGVATFEFPHLLQMVRQNQFDTAYHEHYSYLSLTTVERIFSSNGLMVFDVEEVLTHGGSLRVFAQRSDTGRESRATRVSEMLKLESNAGVSGPDFYVGFQQQAENVKDYLLAFLLQSKRNRECVAGYGAAAKGNTLLNFAGVKFDLMEYIVDANPAKQGKFMPGSRIPILPPAALNDRPPKYLLILPWNIAHEVMQHHCHMASSGMKFVTAVPALEIV